MATSLILPLIRRIKESGEVLHTTINLLGEGGVARLHLIPSQFSFRPLPSLLIVNGVYRMPLKSGLAALMRIFINTMNQFGDNEKEISEVRMNQIVNLTVKRLRWLYPELSREQAQREIASMMELIRRIARNEPISVEEFGYTMSEWAQIAQGPERMDLMVMPVLHNGVRVCNADCGACYAKDLQTGVLPTWAWKWIISRLKYCGVSQVTFTGGEPTLRKDLPDLIHAARFYVTRLNTNGFTLDPYLVRDLVDADLDMIQITYYSSFSSIHDELMGRKGASKFSRRAIEWALDGGLNVSVNIPIVAENSLTFVDTLQCLFTLGVRYVTCSGLIPTGGAKDRNILTRDKLYEVVRDGIAFAQQSGMDLQFTSPGQLTDEQLKDLGLAVPMCGAGLSNMAIRPDGQVVPCQSWITAPLGSMMWKPWEWIWEHPKTVVIRKNNALKNQCPLKEE